MTQGSTAPTCRCVTIGDGREGKLIVAGPICLLPMDAEDLLCSGCREHGHLALGDSRLVGLLGYANLQDCERRPSL